VAGDVSPILDSQPIEKFANHSGSVHFLPTEFRVLVEHAAKLNETVLERLRNQRHDCDLTDERTTTCWYTHRRVRPDRQPEETGPW
jgi:hypothetical protein